MQLHRRALVAETGGSVVDFAIRVSADDAESVLETMVDAASNSTAFGANLRSEVRKQGLLDELGIAGDWPCPCAMSSPDLVEVAPRRRMKK